MLWNTESEPKKLIRNINWSSVTNNRRALRTYDDSSNKILRVSIKWTITRPRLDWNRTGTL